VIEGLLAGGMDVARINTSHADPAEHARRIRQVRGLAKRMALPLAILVDLPGPKFRVGQLEGGARELSRGAMVSLAAVPGDPAALPVPHRGLVRSLRVNQPVYLSDGSVRLRVDHAEPGRAICEVVAGGTVRSGSGINVPESALPAFVPTPEDRRNIRFAVAQEADWIGVSFVESARDLARVRKMLPSGPGPLLIAKIERRRAVAALEPILEAADGVMVARGDLGVETELAELPLLQKRIIAMANARARPVITATQMLESMVDLERPTRAETTDIANAVLDGTDAVMLSAETAIGRFPVRAVETMRRVLIATESEYAGRMARGGLRDQEPGVPRDAMSFVACQLAVRLGAKAIVARVSSAGEALEIARFRPGAPLVLATDSERLARCLAAVRGVAPLVTSSGARDIAALARTWLKARHLARRGDTLVVVKASDSGADRPDTVQVTHV
jgi:pyruvate kinase